MREIESAVTLHAPVPAPGVAALARDGLAPEDSIWAEQYLESGKHFDVSERHVIIFMHVKYMICLYRFPVVSVTEPHICAVCVTWG